LGGPFIFFDQDTQKNLRVKIGSAAVRVGLFSVLEAHQSGNEIEQETRRRGDERRKNLTLSAQHLLLLRSPRLLFVIFLFGFPMKLNPHETSLSIKIVAFIISSSGAK
jgi:hypothetical protein